MFDNRQKVMERVMSLPKGTPSPSRRYWCVTCKMLFTMDQPVCPYMPKMCINTPIPVELMPVESAICLEKLGLFYPKIPQQLMAHLADPEGAHPSEPINPGALVDAYLSFLGDWGIRYQNEPLQTLKSFIILLSGCETAQRVSQSGITFIVTDLTRLWKKDTLIPLLEKALPLLAAQVGITQPLHLDEMDLMGDKPSGRYYCPMCHKFFEFSTQKDSITCPLMAQKCMATPTAIANIKYTLGDLARVYEVTPDFYRRLIRALPPRADARAYLERVLRNDWHFTIEPDLVNHIAEQLGI
jgi:hypothetical protein